ncbi:MAG: rhodanese-like domain-containing protein [Gammaproteobacteria bacterium]
MVKEMTPVQFKARAETGWAPILLDVREAWELAIARLDEAAHIPMGEVPARLAELDRDRDIVVLCRSGGRSAQVAGFLEQQGFEKVWNLAGGILAWSDQLDSSIPQY